MNIEKFPRFTTISKNTKVEIESITNKFDSYSDFNFTSLFCWNIDDSAQVSLLNDNLVIRLPDYITGEQIYSVLGANNIDDTFYQLKSVTSVLELVPEVVIDNIISYTPKSIIEDIDNHDYVYNTHDMHSLIGGNYKKIRNKISRFERDNAHKQIDIAKTSIVHDDDKAEILGIYDRWVADPRNADSINLSERTAIERLLAYSKEINFVLVKMFIDESLVGFSFNEVLPMGNAVCHFEKAIIDHENTYSYFVHEVTKALIEFGCDRVNWEQDLGLLGLRQIKKSYNPSEMLKKYTVHL